MTKKQSETRNNIRAKRRKRLLRAILGLFKLALLLCFLAAVGWGSWLELCRGAAVYREYHAKYENFRERREAARVPMDEKFEAYMNILVLGVDKGGDFGGGWQDFLVQKTSERIAELEMHGSPAIGHTATFYTFNFTFAFGVRRKRQGGGLRARCLA